MKDQKQNNRGRRMIESGLGSWLGQNRSGVIGMFQVHLLHNHLVRVVSVTYSDEWDWNRWLLRDLCTRGDEKRLIFIDTESRTSRWPRGIEKTLDGGQACGIWSEDFVSMSDWIFHIWAVSEFTPGRGPTGLFGDDRSRSTKLKSVNRHIRLRLCTHRCSDTVRSLTDGCLHLPHEVSNRLGSAINKSLPEAPVWRQLRGACGVVRLLSTVCVSEVHHAICLDRST